MTQVKALLTEEVEHGLNARLAHVIEARNGAVEPLTAKDVSAARRPGSQPEAEA